MLRKFTFLLVVLTLLVVGCGGSTKLSSTNTGDVPAWYLNNPQEDDFLFAAATATSKDMQLAIDKATTDARAEIGRQVDVSLAGLQKSFTEEIGVGENSKLLEQFTQASKNVVSVNLAGSTPLKKKVNKDGENWRAYVLVKYPTLAAKESLLAQIKKDENTLTRLRSTKIFKELEMEVQNKQSK